MSAFEDTTASSAESGAGQPHHHERKSTWRGVMMVLGVLMAVGWVANVYDHLSSKSATEAPPPTEAAPTGEPVTLASAIGKYKIAQAACETSAFGLEHNVGTIQNTKDVCADSMQAVMDLPALYGPPAAPLQSCVDMEGTRLNSLWMAEAIQEYRGDPMQDQIDKAKYIRNFRLARPLCASALVNIQREIGAAQ